MESSQIDYWHMWTNNGLCFICCTCFFLLGILNCQNLGKLHDNIKRILNSNSWIEHPRHQYLTSLLWFFTRSLSITQFSFLIHLLPVSSILHLHLFQSLWICFRPKSNRRSVEYRILFLFIVWHIDVSCALTWREKIRI